MNISKWIGDIVINIIKQQVDDNFDEILNGCAKKSIKKGYTAEKITDKQIANIMANHIKETDFLDNIPFISEKGVYATLIKNDLVDWDERIKDRMRKNG